MEDEAQQEANYAIVMATLNQYDVNQFNGPQAWLAAVRKAFEEWVNNADEDTLNSVQLYMQGDTALIGLIQRQVPGAFIGWPRTYTNALHKVWGSILNGDEPKYTAALIGDGHQWSAINLFIAQHGWPAKEAFVTWCRYVRMHALLHSLLSNDYTKNEDAQEEHFDGMLEMWVNLTTRLNIVLDPLEVQL